MKLRRKIETNERLGGGDSGGEDVSENEEKKTKKKDDWQPQPRLNLIVGFLRLANYVCAVNVVFGVAVSILWPRMDGEPEPK